MKLSAIYETAVKCGIEFDPRGKERIKKELERVKKEYEKLTDREKKGFDLERLKNPYADTRILVGDHEKDIKRVLAGIDIEIGEILLAQELKERGQKIDLVLSHHPEGRALANFYNVMYMQVDMLNKVGVPINIAEGITQERIKEVERKILPVNHTRAVDAARLLNMPFLCIHTPSDNAVANFLQKIFDKRPPETLSEILEILNEQPEYQEASQNNASPKIIKGEKDRRCGKIFVDMTGGTEGSKDMFERLSQAGVGTLVSMHLSEEHFKKLENQHLNVIVAGHISSDTIGLNLILDELEKKEKLNFIPCSGFRRFRRNE